MTSPEEKFVKTMLPINQNVARLIAEKYKKDNPNASDDEIKRIYNENLTLMKVANIMSIRKSNQTDSNIIKEWITDFSKLLWHWLISIVPGGIIAAIGLYLSSIYHQNWIWNISGTLALIITVILFIYNSRND